MLKEFDEEEQKKLKMRFSGSEEKKQEEVIEKDRIGALQIVNPHYKAQLAYLILAPNQGHNQAFS